MVYSYSVESRPSTQFASPPDMAVADDEIPEDKLSYIALLPVFLDITFTYAVGTDLRRGSSPSSKSNGAQIGVMGWKSYGT